jgi:hypothetical protein
VEAPTVLSFEAEPAGELPRERVWPRLRRRLFAVAAALALAVAVVALLPGDAVARASRSARRGSRRAPCSRSAVPAGSRSAPGSWQTCAPRLAGLATATATADAD